MKFSTRARYGLRMMIELARELRKHNLVQLGRIAQITGVSENYLAQLAIGLRNHGLIVGVSGKHGGYHLTRTPDKISLLQIVKAVDGPVNVTECVANPAICLNSSMCEARMIWAIVSGSIESILENHSLADMIDKQRVGSIRTDYAHIPMLDADRLLAEAAGEEQTQGCPGQTGI